MAMQLLERLGLGENGKGKSARDHILEGHFNAQDAGYSEEEIEQALVEVLEIHRGKR